MNEVNIKKVVNGYIITEIRPSGERVEQWVCESDDSLYGWIHNEFSIDLKENKDDN